LRPRQHNRQLENQAHEQQQEIRNLGNQAER
jgi:hypothetical protein